MVISKVGGISIIGTYHEKNQDCFLTQTIGDINILALSDGLGSLKHSEIGARAACEAVVEAVINTDFNKCSPKDFITYINDNWQRLINLPINECGATCLFCAFSKEKVLAGQLGDGFICLIGKDDNRVIFDTKDDCFENETDCLSADFDINRWRICEISRECIKAIIMCSDGVKLCNNSSATISNFAKDIFCEYADKSDLHTQSEIKGWLSNWTGKDDKTLVYFFGGEQCQCK